MEKIDKLKKEKNIELRLQLSFLLWFLGLPGAICLLMWWFFAEKG